MRLFETGVDRCVLYPEDVNTDSYQTGVLWNGVIAITETDNDYSLSPLSWLKKITNDYLRA